MKRFLFIIGILMTSLVLFAQSISVTSFKMLPYDLTANTNGTEVLDQNGDKAALIKVVTTQTGFTFEGGALGITKVKQENGEVWVYVPQKSKKITIKHSQLGVLRDYYFPCAIEAARTYEMQLVSGTVQTVVKQDFGGGFLALKVTPPTASVSIDDKLQPGDQNGEYSFFLDYGTHSYCVEAASYRKEVGTFEIGKDRLSKNVNLVSLLSTLNITCSTTDAYIYINQKEYGQGNVNTQLPAGKYLIECRKNGYRTYAESIDIGEQVRKNLSITSLQPLLGSLKVNYKPIDAEVYLDGIKLGLSPNIFHNVLVGEHKIIIAAKNYDTVRETITIKEGETTEISGALEKTQTTIASSSVNFSRGSYSGQKQNGVPNGKGKMTFSDGSYYEGYWRNGKQNGNGKFYDADTKTIQEGLYTNGICSKVIREYSIYNKPSNNVSSKASQNSIFYQNGTYRGQTLDGIPNGKGRLTYNDGSYYEGDWVNGQKEGNGKYYDVDTKTIQEGIYHNGVCSKVTNEYRSTSK